MKTRILVENISKQYRLGEVGTGTISHDLNRWWANFRGKEDPFAKVGELNDRTKKQKSDYVWAIKDINFKVKEGEILGIVGKNGAGKSTLLKILSKITGPTTGVIKINGRVGSLLEVGTGMHHELTGRENIYLNGAILGMKKQEIRAKFDDIVDFAGIVKYVDTPLKRYSSGMQVRLGFAVAAFLEPEILIVDEVLAVGDSDFQKRAIGKMKEVSEEKGRTVLFVSHNMSSVSSLCTSGMYLENGTIKEIGLASTIVSLYMNNGNAGRTNSVNWELTPPNYSDKVSELINMRLVDSNKNTIKTVYIENKLGVEINYKILKTGFNPVPNIHLFTDKGEKLLISVETSFEKKGIGLYKSTVFFPEHFFNEGVYHLGFALSSLNPTKVHAFDYEAISFEVIDNLSAITRNGFTGKFDCSIRPLLNWESKKIK